MALNDYSRRSNKDVFFGDEPLTTPSSTPLASQYTPPEKSETADSNTDDDFDVQKFIRENDSDITKTITAKIASHILAVGLIPMLWELWKWWVMYVDEFNTFACFVIVIWGSIGIFSITKIIFSKRYTNYIERAVKYFKKIKLYNHTAKGGAAWGKMIDCPGDAFSRDLTRIEINNKIIKVLYLEIYKYESQHHKIYFNGEYYEISLGDKAFANNVMLVNGSIPNVKTRHHSLQHNGYTIHFYNDDNLKSSDMNRVYALAGRLRNALGDKEFLIDFAGERIMLLLPTDYRDNYFTYDCFNYTIADRLRRDVNIFKERIKIAKILDSA